VGGQAVGDLALHLDPNRSEVEAPGTSDIADSSAAWGRLSLQSWRNASISVCASANDRSQCAFRHRQGIAWRGGWSGRPAALRTSRARVARMRARIRRRRDLLRVHTEAEKCLLPTALNLVEPVAFARSMAAKGGGTGRGCGQDETPGAASLL